MDITNIFCQSLGVTSHAKTFLTVCRFRTDLVSVLTARGIRSKKIVIRSNDLGYLFEKSCHPFKRLGIYIRLKKLLSVRTARAIRSKKNLATVRATEAICSKINFSRVSSQNHFVTRHLCRTSCYSPGHVRYEFCLQTYHNYMNSYASLLLCSHLCFHIISRLQTVSTYVSVNT